MNGREVFVRTKHDLFKAMVVGWWEDKAGEGPVIETSSGGHLKISMIKIIKFWDTDEVSMIEAEI
jgi:hypothetical protein